MCSLISVIIPTHDPDRTRLARTLDGLRAQTLPHDAWELLLIDNASSPAVTPADFDLAWHAGARIVREEKIGLTSARLAGIRASQGGYLLFVDDDNVLCPDYLKNVVEIFREHAEVGAIGGKSHPEFEVTPEPWVAEFHGCLALRDCGDEARISSYVTFAGGEAKGRKGYPDFAPLGAGMAIRREAAEKYVAKIETDTARRALDRSGNSLTSGGDNDFVMTALDEGWLVGYFPQLQLTHLIPAGRISKEYLARLNRGIARSWVQVLDVHGICPWTKIERRTLPLRKLKAFFSNRAWSDSAAYVRWQGACGMYEGLSDLQERDGAQEARIRKASCNG